MSVRIGIIPLLMIVFAILKLTNVIDWNWWYILTPLVFAVLIFALLGAIYLIADWAEKR